MKIMYKTFRGIVEVNAQKNWILHNKTLIKISKETFLNRYEENSISRHQLQ